MYWIGYGPGTGDRRANYLWFIPRNPAREERCKQLARETDRTLSAEVLGAYLARGRPGAAAVGTPAINGRDRVLIGRNRRPSYLRASTHVRVGVSQPVALATKLFRRYVGLPRSLPPCPAFASMRLPTVALVTAVLFGAPIRIAAQSAPTDSGLGAAAVGQISRTVRAASAWAYVEHASMPPRGEYETSDVYR